MLRYYLPLRTRNRVRSPHRSIRRTGLQVRFIQNLSPETRSLLHRIYQESQHHRVRQRAHCILLSYQGINTTALMAIFSVDRITIYNWFEAWEAQHFAGLYDKKRCGRPPKLTDEEQKKAQHYLEQHPRDIRKVVHLLEQDTTKRVRACLKRCLEGDSPDHDMDHCHINHRFAGVREILVIFAQPTVLVKPAECAFDDPPLRQDYEAFEAVGALDDLQADLAIPAQQRHPGLQEARIGAISPNAAQPREPMPQEAQKELGAVTILHACGRHHYSNEQPQRVYQDMALAPFDLFGTIKACGPSAIGGLDALRVDNRGAGLAVAAFQDAEVTAQGIVDPFPGTIFSPAPKVMIDDAPGRQIVGDKAPRTAGAQDIQDRIDDLALGINFWSTTRLGGRDHWFENLPFGIMEVGWVRFSGLHTAILPQQITPIPTFFDTLLPRNPGE